MRCIYWRLELVIYSFTYLFTSLLQLERYILGS